MLRRSFLMAMVLVTVAMPVAAKKSVAEVLEDFRVLLEKSSYKSCIKSKTLSKYPGFCDCYSIKSSDEFNRSDLIHFAKTKKFSDDYRARKKRIAVECLKEAKNR